MNGEPEDAGRLHPHGRSETEIAVLAARIQELNRRGAIEYAPLVETILRSNDQDIRRIEHTLDGLLDFCGDSTVLTLFRRLCRHYWHIAPAAAVYYVRLYREIWNPESLMEPGDPAD